MNRTVQLCWRATRACLATIFSFALWTVWLALGALLVVQLWIAATSELAVPDFLLKSLEDRLAASGLHATFGRTTFDPRGHLLIEDVKLSLPRLSEPIATARAIYTRVDLWSLSVGRFEPIELRITGANLLTPALLSPSGKTEELIRDLDLVARPSGHEVTLEHASFHLGNVSFLAHGTIDTTALKPRTSGPALPLAELLARNYPALARRAASLIERLSVATRPVVRVELTPSPTRGAIAELALFTPAVKLETPIALQASDLVVTTRLPLTGETNVMAALALSAGELRLPRDITVSHATVQLRGRLDSTSFKFDPVSVEIAAASASGLGYTASAPWVLLTPGPLPKLRATLLTRIAGERLALAADLNLETKTADLRFSGAVAPALLDNISATVGKNVRQFVDLTTPLALEGTARFDPDWHFARVATRVATANLIGYHVTFGEVRGQIEFDGRRFYAPEAFATIGKNFAHGSFDQDLVTYEHRFLLEGQLRPMDIAPWFHDWWPAFFGDFKFPAESPSANVDVRGRWGHTRESAIFVFATSGPAVVRGAAWDRVRTRLFIRPNFSQVTELLVAKGATSARGTFSRRYDLDAAAWQSVDFDFTSDVDPAEAVKFFQGAADPILSPFKFSLPPSVKISGHLTGPASPAGVHSLVTVAGRTDAPFHYYDFPADRIGVTVTVRDDTITLDPLQLGVAGGDATGTAKIIGHGDDRRLAFDAQLKNTNLGRVIASIDEFNAARQATAVKTPNRFLKEHSDVRLDVTARAEGRLADPFSYQGEGHAELKGAELAEVRLLGVFSEVLPFTSLRFNAGRGDFKIAGPRLEFPEIKITGANSAMDARGAYALDRRELDFNVKVYPLQESTNPLKVLANAVLTPLTSIFEVHLTGPLDKPKPSLVIAPTNLLRGLAPGDSSKQPAPPPASSATPSPAEPAPEPTPPPSEPKPAP